MKNFLPPQSKPSLTKKVASKHIGFNVSRRQTPKGFKIVKSQAPKGFNFSRRQAPKGFTLIELLVTVSILALLATLGLIAYNSAGQQGRNSKRKADLKAIQSALEAYFVDNRSYPSAGASNCNNPPTYINSLSPNYMPTLPISPLCTRAGFGQYIYATSGTPATSYTITVQLSTDCPTGGVPPTDEFYVSGNPCVYQVRNN